MLLTVAPASSSSRRGLWIHIHAPQHLSLFMVQVRNKKPCKEAAESWEEGISGPCASYRHVTNGPTTVKLWRHGKKVVCVCYRSEGKRIAPGRLFYMPSALKQTPACTTISTCKHAALLLYNIYTYTHICSIYNSTHTYK